jgi:hypothetical protein
MRTQFSPRCRSLTCDRPAAAAPRFASRLDIAVPPPSPAEKLLARLLARALRTFPEPHFKRPLLRAARSASSLAERAGYALLLLPELFAELAIAEMVKSEYLRLGRF